MTTFFFILEKWTRVCPSLLLLFLEQKMGKWGKRTYFVRENFYFVGCFQNSKGRNKNSKGRNRKNVRQNCINNTSLFQNDTSFLHKQAQVSKKTSHNRAKTTEIYDFQNRWESRISQLLFLCSDFRVKWRDRKCKQIAKTKIPPPIDH